ADLAGQRQGMLVAVDEADPGHILGACHAMFDGGRRNADGQPYAWISNLTTDPAARGRGLGRALLTAGLHELHAQGAGSVALGVDGGAVVPLALYRSVGFATISAVAISVRPAMEPSRIELGVYLSDVNRIHDVQTTSRAV
ncbi:MAG: GNAT family N-acetyltransferase, partial [Chloroflexota bacterium]|nr:GNAT family N-acetyltransferase [Chloroflexota bacterium]